MKFKEVIAVNHKLETFCDRYVTVLNNTLKPTKHFYKMMVEKHNVYPTNHKKNGRLDLNKKLLKRIGTLYTQYLSQLLLVQNFKLFSIKLS